MFNYMFSFSHICHNTLEEALRQFHLAKEELVAWGFTISEAKLVMPGKKNMILGYEVDTHNMILKFDVAKFDEVKFLIEDALQPFVQAKHLARIVGKLMSLGYACSVPVACFMPRAIAAIAVTTIDGDWRSWRKEIEVTREMHEELLFLLNNIRNWNGVAVKKPMAMHFYHSTNPIAEETFQPFIGDASQEAAAFFSIRNPHKFAIKFFDQSMAMESSSRRELASIESLIMDHADWIQPNSIVVYASDNTSVNR